MQNCKKLYIVIFMLFTMVASACFCQAIPTQFGDTGLVSQPTAETLNSGNICVGIIANCAENDGKTATVLPVFMTLGLGSFLEAYGSYPNILFNEDEEASGRGYSNVGFKIRVFGKRSSQFKLGLDGQLRRTVSGNINYDGLTDQVYRAIASYNNGTFGLHGNAGLIKPESPQYITYEKQFMYGGGLEYLPNSRLRLLTEIGIESSKSQGLSDRAEVTAGFQYFLSPHLTLNIALAKGFTDESPEWRALFGFSSCQGIGTYQRPIPRKVAPQTEQPVEEKVELKALKIRTLTPLSPKKKVVEPLKSSSKYEVPVGEQAEVVTLSPATASSTAESLTLAEGAAITAVTNAPLEISSGIPLLQVAPEISGSVAATALALPVNDALTLSAPRPARSYKINDVVKTDDNQVVGKKIVEDLRYQAKFYSITETSTTFSATFFHKYDKPLDVWIEGAGKANTKLSQSKAAPYEEVTLTIDKVNGKVPYFKLHIGELSEIFEFFPLRKSVKLGKIEINIKPAVDGVASSADTTAAPEVGAVTEATSAATTSPVATVTVPVTTSVLSSGRVTAGSRASNDAATTISSTGQDKTPGAGSTTTPASVGATFVGGITSKPALPAAPEVGTVAATANAVTPSAGAIAATPITNAPGSGSITAGTKVSAPAPATTIPAPVQGPAPSVGSSATLASVSAAPVVSGVAANLVSPAAPEVGTVASPAGAGLPSAGTTTTAPVTTSVPSSDSVTAGTKASVPAATTTISSPVQGAAPGIGNSTTPASVSVAPVVSGVAANLVSPAAPEVGTVASPAGAGLPSAGAIAATPITNAPGSGSITAGTKVSAPATATTIPAPVQGPAPSVGSSATLASVSVAPVVSGVAGNLVSPAAPEVGTVASPAGAGLPSAGAIAATPITTKAPSSGSITAGTKASVPATATTISSPAQGAAPGIGSSTTPASVSVAPVVSGVAANPVSPAAPEVETVVSSAGAGLPSAGAIAATPITTKAPSSGSITAGTKASVLAATATTIPAPVQGPAPSVGSSTTPASVSVAPVVSGVAANLVSPAAPEVGTVASPAGAGLPSAGAIAATPITNAPGSGSITAGTKVSAPATATTIPAPVQGPAPSVGSSATLASVSVAPVVSGVAGNLVSPAAPEVGTVASPAGAGLPSAGAIAATPITTKAPSSGSITAGTKASVPATATTISSPAQGAAPGIGSSTTPASVSVAPVVSGVAANPVSPAAPEVETVASSAGAGLPSAGAIAATPITTKAPSSGSITAGTKASVLAATATTIPAPVQGPALSVGSSATPASVSAAPVVGAVSGSSTAVAPSAGAIPFSGVVASPKSGSAVTTGKGASPIAGKLTAVPVTGKTAPEARLSTVAPEVTTTPGGSTVILLNSGSAPQAGVITTGETITVRPPVSGSLSAVPTKTVQAIAYKKFRLPSTVIFAFDDATLTEEGKLAITDVVEAITTEKRWYVIRVDGFTDSLGSDDYNIKLGLRRAISVASYMVTNNGIDPSIVFVKSSGENDPIATNETEEGRTLNRRAEIVLFVQKED